MNFTFPFAFKSAFLDGNPFFWQCHNNFASTCSTNSCIYFKLFSVTSNCFVVLVLGIYGLLNTTKFLVL